MRILSIILLLVETHEIPPQLAWSTCPPLFSLEFKIFHRNENAENDISGFTKTKIFRGGSPSYVSMTTRSRDSLAAILDEKLKAS